MGSQALSNSAPRIFIQWIRAIQEWLDRTIGGLAIAQTVLGPEAKAKRVRVLGRVYFYRSRRCAMPWTAKL